MLVLMFEAGGGRYALPTRDVAEVVPWVDVQPVAHAPEWVAGFFSYRGAITPVLDLGRMAGGAPCRCRYDSRLVLVAVGKRLIALRAEGPTTAQLADDAPREEAGGWGPLLLDERGVFRLIQRERLLPSESLAVLFPA